ncbi:MAG: pyridoxal-phosphate dependent enzyme [Chitinispirillaceae bacterium]|nr:pyridoxal-phosphate dependent enzyme [Chitinispirillaceae bacterium]
MACCPDPPLFRHCPRLKGPIACHSLGVWPTPVEPLAGLGSRLGRTDLFIKRDDLSGRPYGGNKLRKLEFLLADAQRLGARRIITCGAAGSNHALATALYARHVGLAATLILFDQPASEAVQCNLLMDASTGAEMLFEERYENYPERIREIVSRYTAEEGVAPYVIDAGGSSPLGVLGYVNAVFELRDQIRENKLPEPHAIYAAFGTMGTVAGLILGLKAAGLSSRVIAARVVPASLASREKLIGLCEKTIRMLGALDPSLRDLKVRESDVRIVSDHFEPGYGLASPSVHETIRCAHQHDGLALDTTYSGKAFAAFLSDARQRHQSGPLLFINTKNSRPLPDTVVTAEYRALPAAFHRFFTDQPSPASAAPMENHAAR